MTVTAPWQRDEILMMRHVISRQAHKTRFKCFAVLLVWLAAGVVFGMFNQVISRGPGSHQVDLLSE